MIDQEFHDCIHEMVERIPELAALKGYARYAVMREIHKTLAAHLPAVWDPADGGYVAYNIGDALMMWSDDIPKRQCEWLIRFLQKKLPEWEMDRVRSCLPVPTRSSKLP